MRASARAMAKDSPVILHTYVEKFLEKSSVTEGKCGAHKNRLNAWNASELIARIGW